MATNGALDGWGGFQVGGGVGGKKLREKDKVKFKEELLKEQRRRGNLQILGVGFKELSVNKNLTRI